MKALIIGREDNSLAAKALRGLAIQCATDNAQRLKEEMASYLPKNEQEEIWRLDGIVASGKATIQEKERLNELAHKADGLLKRKTEIS